MGHPVPTCCKIIVITFVVEKRSNSSADFLHDRYIFGEKYFPVLFPRLFSCTNLMPGKILFSWLPQNAFNKSNPRFLHTRYQEH